jgi:hypothetical protein
VRRLSGRKGWLPQSARPRVIGLTLTKEDHQGESGEGKAEKQYGYARVET